MSTPNRGKKVAATSPDKSLRHFRWTQPFEDTLLELLLRESKKGNRPDSTFTASAFRSVVADFDRIHGTSIMKKHILSRIKTMKMHFVAFHGAFNGLSGFSWNDHSKMFEAEDDIWDQRIKENSKLEKFRYRACHNWDKLCELYGNTRATGEEARSIKEKSKSLKRSIEFEDNELDPPNMSTSAFATNETSSYGDCDFSNADAAAANTQEQGSNQQSSGSSKKKQKKLATWVSVMEDGYKDMAASIRELSLALKDSGEKVAGSKFDVEQNSQILGALSSLGLDEKYKVSCYFYLNANPSKAALLVAAPVALRATLLAEIMDAAKDGQL